jgi:hypothetical protein
VMLMASFVFHFLGMQGIITEFVPLMLALAVIYLSIYRQANVPATTVNN